MKLTIKSNKKSIIESAELMEEIVEKLKKNIGIDSIEIRGLNIIEHNKDDIDIIKDYIRTIDIMNPDINDNKFIEFFEKRYQDPITFYVFLKRYSLEHQNEEITKLIQLLENTRIVKKVKDKLIGYKYWDRDIYKFIFEVLERTNYSMIKYSTRFPAEGKLIDEYTLEDRSKIRIFYNNGINYYHILPYELLLNDELNKIVNDIIKSIYLHPDFLDNENMREVIRDFARSKLIDKNIKDINELDRLTNLIVRNTIGYGVIETLVLDEYIEDIFINKKEKNIFLKHGKYGDCKTNIIISSYEISNLLSKIKMVSGRPIDASNPVLDSMLDIEKKVRISISVPPFSKDIAMTFRKYRLKPWTLPLFIQNNTISPLGAAFLSFIVNNGRSILFAGGRGAGKTSFLIASLFEMLPKNRIVVIQDTEEIPVEEAEKLNYNILSLKVRNPLSLESAELSPEDGLRASLRFGDSSLIVGEIRGKEAKMLYEAMRIGALSNFVGGTIHAQSPYGVFDRVVNDLGVTPSSFKATDYIVMIGTIKLPFSNTYKRRVLSITEVNKKETDPEKMFNTLFEYNSKKDILEMKNIEDSFILKEIEKRSGLSVKKIVKFINSLAEIKNIQVNAGKKNPRLLEIEGNLNVNRLITEIINEEGYDGVVDVWKKRFQYHLY